MNIKLILGIVTAWIFSNPMAGQSSIDHNIYLPEVIQIIEEKFQVKVAYDFTLLEHMPVTNLEIGKTVEETLESLIENQNLQYLTLDPQKILLRRKVEIIDSQPSNFKITGRVLDRETGEALPYAANFTNDLSTGTTTDDEGMFSLQIKSPDTLCILNIQYLGYQSEKKEINTKSPGKLDFFLGIQPQMIPSIIIAEQQPLTQNSQSQAMNVRFSKWSAGFSPVGRDVLRSLHFLPGVQGHNDLSANPIIRGGNPEGNSLLLNGMPILRVDHYFGIFSVVNTSMVKNMSLYKNYYPGEFAGNVSSLLQIETRSANKLPGIETNIELNNLAASLNSRFSFGSNLSGQVSFRSTLQDLSNTSIFGVAYQGNESITSTILDSRKLFESLNPSFRFYDLYAQIEGRLTEKTNLSLQFFKSQDGFIYDRELQFGLLRPGGRILNRETYLEEGKWQNQAFSIDFQHQFSTQLNSSLGVSKSYFTQNESNELTVTRIPKSENDLKNGHNYSNDANLWELGWINKYTSANGWTLKGGFQAQWIAVNIALNPLPLYPEITSSTSRLNHQANNSIWSGFLEINSSEKKSLQGALSLRSSYDHRSDKLYWLPQGKFSFQVDKHWKLYGAAGKYVQFLRTSTHEGPLGGNFEFFVISDGNIFPALEADKISLGVSGLSNTWGFDLETYYHKMDGVVEHLLLNPGFELNRPFRTLKYQLLSGQGKAFGIDATIRKHRGKYTGWITYSLGKNSIKIAKINAGESYPSEYDRRHQLKWINFFEFGKWKINAAFTLASGRPYLDYQSYKGQDRTQNYRVYIEYLNPYNRFDLGINYSFKIATTKASIGVDLFNVLNHENVRYLQYAYAVQGAETANSNLSSLILGNQQEMLPFTPTLSFSWKF